MEDEADRMDACVEENAATLGLREIVMPSVILAGGMVGGKVKGGMSVMIVASFSTAVSVCSARASSARMEGDGSIGIMVALTDRDCC
jgi:hypothetical protein